MATEESSPYRDCGAAVNKSAKQCPACGADTAILSPGSFRMTIAAGVFCLGALVYSLYALIGT